MSNTRNNAIEDYSQYDRMSDDELEEILRQDAEDMEADETNVDAILYIMGVLADRSDDPYEKTAEQAFQSFQENYYPLGITEVEDKCNVSQNSLNSGHVPKRIQWLRRPMTAAAVIAIVLVMTVSVQAFGFDLWGELAKWTKEVFHFASDYQSSMGDPYSNDDNAFKSLQEALSKKNIPENIIPTWIPEEYVFQDINLLETPKSNTVIAKYQNDTGKQISIQIKSYVDKYVQQIEKGENLLEVYTINGIDVFVFNNYELYYACWIIDNYECYISGDLTLDNLYMILKSIKGEP